MDFIVRKWVKSLQQKWTVEHSVFVIGIISLYIGLGTEFRSEKIRGIDSEQFPLFRGSKWSFRGIQMSTEESVPKLGMDRNYSVIIFLSEIPNPSYILYADLRYSGRLLEDFLRFRLNKFSSFDRVHLHFSLISNLKKIHIFSLNWFNE